MVGFRLANQVVGMITEDMKSYYCLESMAVDFSVCLWEQFWVDMWVVYNTVPSMGSKSHLLI